jgi:hypothetical protein
MVAGQSTCADFQGGQRGDESQKELSKSALTTAFIVEGGDFDTSRLFSAAKRANREGREFVSQGYGRREINPVPRFTSVYMAARLAWGANSKFHIQRILGRERHIIMTLRGGGRGRSLVWARRSGKKRQSAISAQLAIAQRRKKPNL